MGSNHIGIERGKKRKGGIMIDTVPGEHYFIRCVKVAVVIGGKRTEIGGWIDNRTSEPQYVRNMRHATIYRGGEQLDEFLHEHPEYIAVKADKNNRERRRRRMNK